MKVVLTKDVKNTGRAHEVVEVADGHALNFLIPKKMAVVATPAARKVAEGRLAASAADRAKRAQAVADRLQALASEKPTVKKKANEQGHLYDAVTVAEIAAAAGVPEDAIDLDRPIKEIGAHEIPVSFGDDSGAFTLEVVAE
ncbi:MAG TPA: 50S ribosomal protein L9 [Candidatus Paceibacterota bacterium]|nr:50S ribosomal protein L9 [Candidatus Paceibacterota bacterium]